MITIDCEGCDGAGKTTGLKYLIAQAETLGLNVVETREVGNPNVPICVKLREVVLSPESNLSGESMELIFSAMRMENELWQNKLVASGKVDLLVSDRGFLSHLAYTDHNVSPEFADALYDKLMFNITSFPDVVIYFSVDSETALKRRTKRGTTDVIEMKGVEFQDKVRESFNKYLVQYKDKVKMIYLVDANQPLEMVQERLDEIVTDIQRKFF